MSVTWFAPRWSRCRLARATATTVGTEILLEDRGRGPGSSAASIENDVIRAGLESEVDVVLDVLCRYFEAYGDTACGVTDLPGRFTKIRDRAEIGKTGTG